MSAAFPMTWFIAVGAVWLTTSLTARRLRLLYLRVVGDDPSLPFRLTEPGRDPEKLLYFLRESTQPLLQKHPEVWRLRQRLSSLLVLSLVVPVGGFFLIVLVAVVEVRLRAGH